MIGLPVFQYGETLTLVRRTAVRDVEGAFVTDDYGNLTYSETETVVSGVAVWPESAGLGTVYETTVPTERTQPTYAAALPLSVPVDAVDRVLWLGKAYEIQGDPERYRNPMTGVSLQTIRMHRVEG